MGIHETFGEDLLGFSRLWERICDTLGEDSWGFEQFVRLLRGFMRIRQTLGEDLQGFVGIHETLGEDLLDLSDLGEDLQLGFTSLCQRIHGDS